MYPILFSIGPINIYTHGLMMAIGVLVGGGIIFCLAKKEQMPRNFLFDLLIYVFFAGIIGARILYVIFYSDQFTYWREMFYIWNGGLISYGGIVGGFLVAAWILKRKKQDILRWFDIGIIGVLIGWAFGRLGCFFSGDIPGVDSSSWLAVRGQIPVSLFEAVWVLILGIFLYLLSQKKQEFLRRRSGLIFFLGMAGYFLGRFIIDFWRAEPIVLYLKAGQIGALLLFLISAGFLVKIFFEKDFERSENV